jgi:hypothetical protein
MCEAGYDAATSSAPPQPTTSSPVTKDLFVLSLRGCTITFDGVPVMEKGRLIDPPA